MIGKTKTLLMLPGVREFADRLGLLLITCTFTSDRSRGGSPKAHYAAAKNGSGDALVLFFAGENDSKTRLTGIEKAFMDGVRRGAPWCHIVEKNTGHERGSCGNLVLP